MLIKKIFLFMGIFLLLNHSLYSQRLGGGRKPQTNTNQNAQTNANQRVIGDYILHKVKEDEVKTFITLAGRVEASKNIIHYPSISGIINDIYITKNERITKGQALFSIRRSDNQGIGYEKVVVYAQNSGIVSRLNIETNMSVSTNLEALYITDDSKYLVHVNISDRSINYIHKNKEVSLTNNEDIKGKITYVSLLPDYESGLYNVDIEFPKTKSLSLGQFVNLAIVESQKKGILLDRTQVIRRYGDTYVWKMDEKNIIYLNKITLGENYNQKVLVLEGLNIGDEYITSEKTIRENQIVEETPQKTEEKS